MIFNFNPLTKIQIILAALLLYPQVLHAEQKREVYLAAMCELTGTYATIGEECYRGYKIAEANYAKSVNTTVHVLYGDHQRLPRVAISEYRSLSMRHPLLAVMSNAAPPILALNPILRQQKVPLGGTLVYPEFISGNPYGYRFWVPAQKEGGAIADKIIALGKKKIAQIILQDDYPVLIAKAIAARFQEQGGTVVFSEDVIPGATDYSSMLTRLRESKPDAIVVNVLGDQLAVLLKRIREQGMTQQIIGTFSLGRKDIVASAGGSAENVIFVEPNGDKPNFTKQMKDSFGITRITGMNYACYTGLATMLYAIQHNPQVKDTATMQTAMAAQTEVPLLDGPFSMVNREGQYDLVFRIIRNGEVETFSE